MLRHKLEQSLNQNRFSYRITCSSLRSRRIKRPSISSVPRHCKVRDPRDQTGFLSPASLSASAASEVTSTGPGADTPRKNFVLTCPVCLKEQFGLDGMPSGEADLSCPRCNRTFRADRKYIDLTLTSGLQPRVYQQREWRGTELFRSPLVSFAYERGWRESFARAGYPGEEKEFNMAMGYLEPVARGKALMDLSCGSGLFTRRFIRSGKFSGVLAVDFSESMLEQTRRSLEFDSQLAPALRPTRSPSIRTSSASTCPALLLRADVARLPFPSASVPAIHAGAAIHCWPNPQAAFAEISRVLPPGGVFVATTFLTSAAPLGQLLGDSVVRPLNQLDRSTMRQSYRAWEEEELRELCASVGLQDFQHERNWCFIMFAARKPA